MSKVEKRVLIVDDVFEDLASMKSVLEANGYKVVVATNGAKAIDATSVDSFDLILVDIKMPTLSGYDLVNLMHERLDNKTKIVFVSIVPKAQARLDKVDGFIQKPFSPDSFIKEVKKIMK